ncbi:MAG: glycoside hydrolase family 26 protein [Solirubrobacteraceae bacterium]
MLLALLASAVAGPSAAGAAVPGETLGVYTGAGKPDRTAAFEARLGRSVARVHDYLDKTSWSTMLDVGWMADQWASGGYTDRMVITIPMFPNTLTGEDLLARGASGEFNAQFRTLAQRLVAHGLGSSVIRIGHEFNGKWYSWSIDVPNGAANYAAYWRQIVTTMRSVAGTNFTFDWSANADSSWSNGVQLQAADAWPGEAYVDYVGLTVYDQSWVPNYQDPVARWAGYVTQKNGLEWQAAFAASKGKPITFPEWGLSLRPDGHGGGDAPYYIEQMYSWIQSHNVAYHLYFEHGVDGDHRIFGGAFPNAANTFIRLFGPSPPPGPPPPPLPPPPPPPGAGSGSPAGAGSAAEASAFAASLDIARFAGLCIERARISPRTRRLKLLATITRHASGAARVELRAGGRRTRFFKPISHGRVSVSRKLSRKQARRGSGIVTITYGGNASTKPQRVRLRIGPHNARLQPAASPNLVDGRLTTRGTITKSARGAVRVQLKYERDGQTVTRDYKAMIHNGRWRLDAALSQQVRDEIANRRGAVHAYVLYTGSVSRRIGGQMKSYELLGWH